MPKNKKPKKQPNLNPEFVLNPNLIPPKPPKKKRAPDRPQPEWMFPPDADNPVLNPRTKSDEKRQKEKDDHDTSIKYLQYRSVSIPLRTPPPAYLLTLIGAFLTTYGFNSTSRIYTTELASRKKIDEWVVLIDEKLPSGFPDLVSIFKDAYKDWEQNQGDETSSSEESDDEAEGPVEANDAKSSSEDSDDSDSDSDRKKMVGKVSKRKRSSSKSSSNSSGSATSATSDSDDDRGGVSSTKHQSQTPTLKQSVERLRKGAKPAKSVQTTTVTESSNPSNGSATKVTTSASSTSKDANTSSSATSSSESSASPDSETEVTESKAKSIPTGKEDSTSDSESSSSSNDFEEEAVAPVTATATLSVGANIPKNRSGSSSSETLQGVRPSPVKTSLLSPPANPNSSLDAQSNPITSSKRKRAEASSDSADVAAKKYKTPNTPFQRVSKDTPVDAKFSNEYKSYDYADQAHNDLSVVRGKGFTKEKNKKKRGSYRGGAIDTSGGKGVKFDD